jgi:hypothetical protein
MTAIKKATNCWFVAYKNKMGMNICDLDWIRTNGLLLRRQLLYPAELPSHPAFLQAAK